MSEVAPPAGASKSDTEIAGLVRSPVLLLFVLAGLLSLALATAGCGTVAPPAASSPPAPAASPSPSSTVPALRAIQQAELRPSDTGTAEQFGYAVALSGNTALVGAPSIGNGDGVAYVFSHSSSGGWSEQATLQAAPAPSGDDHGDGFGYAVALSGNTALIGAINDTAPGAGGDGVAYVFVRSAGTWSQQAELQASEETAGDLWGCSVALSGNTALVGAMNATVAGQSHAGAAYVFARLGATWSEQVGLTDPTPAPDDGFGQALALSGNTALIGALNKTAAGQARAGAAYLYTRSGTAWSQQAELKAGDAHRADGFGGSVALFGGTALVGASERDVVGQAGAGAAYLFGRTGSGWSEQAELLDPSPASGDNFGQAVALYGHNALVGAFNRQVAGQSAAGEAYLYTRSGTRWTQRAALHLAHHAAGDNFGQAVALFGHTALCGAANERVYGLSEFGSAYVDTLTAK